jgi:hypothetical protein
MKDDFWNAAAARIVLAPLQENLAFSARRMRVAIWVPYAVATHALVAAALAPAARSSSNALAPDFGSSDQQSVPDSKSTVYDEHAVSVTSCMEKVEVSPGYGIHASLRVNSSAAVVSVTLTTTAVS